MPLPRRRPSPTAPARWWVAAVAASVLLAGCSGDDAPEAEGGGGTVTVPIEIPDVVDEVCEDPPGDISDDELVVGTLTQPAGVDLLRAEAHVDPSAVEVTWTVAGDPAAAVGPRYTVTQGNPGDLTSWTVVVEAVEGGWTTTLLTSEQVDDPRGIVLTREVSAPLVGQPEVEPTADGGTAITLRVPRAALPPPATVVWLFGASAAPEGGPPATEAPGATTPDGAEVEAPEPDDVFDDCSNLFDAGS